MPPLNAIPPEQMPIRNTRPPAFGGPPSRIDPRQGPGNRGRHLGWLQRQLGRMPGGEDPRMLEAIRGAIGQLPPEMDPAQRRQVIRQILGRFQEVQAQGGGGQPQHVSGGGLQGGPNEEMPMGYSGAVPGVLEPRLPAQPMVVGGTQQAAFLGGPGVSPEGMENANPSATDDYWTPERMASAQPRFMGVPDAMPAPGGSFSAQTESFGMPGAAPSGMGGSPGPGTSSRVPPSVMPMAGGVSSASDPANGRGVIGPPVRDGGGFASGVDQQRPDNRNPGPIGPPDVEGRPAPGGDDFSDIPKGIQGAWKKRGKGIHRQRAAAAEYRAKNPPPAGGGGIDVQPMGGGYGDPEAMSNARRASRGRPAIRRRRMGGPLGSPMAGG